jgi:hypothetical protein
LEERICVWVDFKCWMNTVRGDGGKEHKSSVAARSQQNI